MELISAVLIVLALGMLVALFVARPFLQGKNPLGAELSSEAQKQEHLRSSLLAERDRVLTALQELDFDYALGKVPDEEYPAMRAALMQTGANVLRQLDGINSEAAGSAAPAASTVEDRIEAAVSARRADSRAADFRADPRASSEPLPEGAAVSANVAVKPNGRKEDSIEDLIAARKRTRSESAAGFCPKCGKPVQKSDKFCSKCGTTL